MLAQSFRRNSKEFNGWDMSSQAAYASTLLIRNVEIRQTFERGNVANWDGERL
jgi:hypothetical protein